MLTLGVRSNRPKGWERVFAAVARTRHAPALHPHGAVFAATLTLPHGWPGPVNSASGPDTHRVIVRMSKGGGLPGTWPDVLGMAIRVPDMIGPGLPVDVLLSSAGRGRFTRWLPVPCRDWRRAMYGSIMPFRCGTSILSLAARPEPGPGPLPGSPKVLADSVRAKPLGFDLVTAAPMQDWHAFGRLVLDEHLPGVDMSFDPVVNAHPHLTPVPRVLSLVRKMAYAGSRQGRRARLT